MDLNTSARYTALKHLEEVMSPYEDMTVEEFVLDMLQGHTDTTNMHRLRIIEALETCSTASAPVVEVATPKEGHLDAKVKYSDTIV